MISRTGKPHSEQHRPTSPPSTAGGEVEFSKLKQPFNAFSVIGMAYTLSATPLAIGTYLVFTVGVGGSPYFFYCYLVCAIMNVTCFLSLAEIASVFPHTSGQIFWTSALMPKKYARVCTYWVGCFTIFGWTFASTGTLLFVGNLTLGIISVCNETYAATPYQLFLVALGSALFGLVFNIPFFKTMPFVTKAMAWFVNAGTVFVFVALLARAPKQSARVVFVDIVNETGWSSDGVTFMLGLLPGLICTGYFDVASHMAEELPHPEKQIPQVMIGTCALCSLSGLVMAVVYLFCMVDPVHLLDPIGAQPLYQLFLDALDSVPLTVTAALFPTIIYLVDVSFLTTTLSRIIWSFARENALPMSRWTSKVDKRWQLPVNAIYVATIITVALALLQFGPSTILNGMFSASIICLYASYSMPILGLVLSGWKAVGNDHYFKLGKIGRVINVVALGWTWLAVVFTAFPTYIPVDLNSMNWAIAIVGVASVCAGINWIFHARKFFTVPKPLYVENLHGMSGGVAVGEV